MTEQTNTYKEPYSPWWMVGAHIIGMVFFAIGTITNDIFVFGGGCLVIMMAVALLLRRDIIRTIYAVQ